MEDAQLIAYAKSAKDKAYAPYSGFPVGAALLCKDGSVYTGCNIENASTPAGICAERSAVANAVSDGKNEFVKIAVISNSNNPCMPCGICRQVLSEFDLNVQVLCAKADESYVAYSLNELLPHAFTELGRV